MNGLKAVITCVLLETTFDLLAAQHLRPGDCPTCAEGYFVIKNCSVHNKRLMGVQCRPCTDCSADHQDTLVQCSTFSDSLCGNKSSPAATSTPEDPPVSSPAVWIIFTVIVCSLFLILLLGLFLSLLSCRVQQRTKLQGLDQS